MAIFTTPYPQFLDANGDPIVNGYVYFGLPNVDPATNPKTINDQDGNILANPQRTNSLGQCEFIIDLNGSYSISVRNSANVQLWSCPEFSGIGSGATGTGEFWEAVTDSGTGETVIRIITGAGAPAAAVIGYAQLRIGTNTSNIDFFESISGGNYRVKKEILQRAILKDTGSEIPTTSNIGSAYAITVAGWSYVDGVIYTLNVNVANTSAVTIDINAAGSKKVLGLSGAAGIEIASGCFVGIQRIRYSSSADGGSGAFIALDAKTFDLTSYSGANVPLAVGETAKYRLSALASLDLRLAISAPQKYAMTIPHITQSVGSVGSRLAINGATQTNVYSEISGVTAAGIAYGSSTATQTDFVVPIDSTGSGELFFTFNSGLTSSWGTGRTTDGSTYSNLGQSFQSKSVTATSFGTIVALGGTVTGEILIERIA